MEGSNINIGVGVKVDTKQARQDLSKFLQSSSKWSKSMESKLTASVKLVFPDMSDSAAEFEKYAKKARSYWKKVVGGDTWTFDLFNKNGIKMGDSIKFDFSNIDISQNVAKDQLPKLVNLYNKLLSGNAKSHGEFLEKDLNNLKNLIDYLTKATESYDVLLRTRSKNATARSSASANKEARELGELERAMRKVEQVQKDIAKEPTRHARGGGQWLSSIYRQINLYHDLEDAARKAGDAKILQYSRNQITALGKQADALERVNNLFGKQGKIVNGLRSVMARYLSIYMVADFGKKIAETTGYFQQQQVALEGILGSASKAAAVLNEIKDFAVRSPFQTKELVTFTKQLAAFGVGDNDLLPTVKKLADISAGLGVDMSRIILAYGQVKSAAVLRGQELRQFTEAGIPMVQALADKFTDLNGRLVTTAEVFKLISERKVPFEMVASVLSDMTAEGGKFYNMQENITNTLYGQIQKLKDLWTLALDKLGKDSNGFIIKIVKGLQNVIKNIQVIGNIGAFAVLGRGIGRLAEGISLVIRRFRAIGAAAVFAKGALVPALGAVMAVIGAVVGAFKSVKAKQEEVQRRMSEVSKSFDRDTYKMTSGIDRLVKKLSSASEGTKKFNDAASAIVSNYGKFLSSDITEALMKQGNEAQEAATKFINMAEAIKESIRQQQAWNKLQEQAKAAAGVAGERGEEGAKKKSSIFRADILSERRYDFVRDENYNLKYTRTPDGRVVPKMAWQNLPLRGVGDFERSNDISHDTFLENIASLYGEVLEEAAEGGKRFKDSENAIKELFADRIALMYQLDETTINAIVERAYKKTARDAKKAFDESAEKYKLADATTFAKITKPFDELDKAIADGNLSDADKLKRTFSALSKALEIANIKGYGTQKVFGEGENAKTLKDLVNSEKLSAQSAYDVIQAIDKFGAGKANDVVTNLSTLSDRFKQYVELRKEQSAHIADEFNNPASELYGWKNKESLKSIVSTYSKPTEATLESLRNQLQDDQAKTKSEIAKLEKLNLNGFWNNKLNELREQLAAYNRLMGGDLYATGEKKTKTGGSTGGGWRRMFGDLFNYIKEARAEEKKLVEFSAGTTKALEEQIKNGQLEGTPVAEFWSEGSSPFKKLIDKISEYGLESDVFNENFLKGELEKIVTNHIKSTGTIDYMDVWNQLIKIMSARADVLGGEIGKAIREFLQGKTVEGEKLFGGSQVERYIKEQLQELRKINGQFENIRSTQNAINSIRGASNAYRAYGALGSRGYTSSADVTRRQLQALLGAKGGQGMSMATPLAKLINGGSLGISSISQILAVRESLSGISASDMKGDDEAARQANFEEFKGVLGQFDQLLNQLTNDILEDFKRLMDARDPFMKATDDIVNAYDEYSKTIAQIAHGLANGDLDKSKKKEMMIQATQNLYTGVAKSLGGDGMPEYINRLFPELSSSTGVSKRGMELGLWLGGGSLTAKAANYAAATAGIKRDDIETEKEFLEAVEKAAGGVLKFAAKMELASAIVQKVDSYIQKSAQFANKLIDALDATNGLVKDENGNYTYENDYSTAKEAIGMISEFSSGISSAFQSLMQGDIFGAITGIGTAIAGFFENLFGIGDSQVQKQQDRIVSSNKSLERAMTNLQHAMEDLAGKDKWDNLTTQIENLRKQQENNKQLEQLEVSKKHGDADKAESYREASEQAAREAENTIREIREEVLGVADDIAGQFTDAFAEAFRNGKNLARAWRDSVRGYISDVLEKTLLQSVVAPRINKILQSFGIEEGKTDSNSIIAILSNPTKMKDLRNSLFAEGTFLQDWLISLPKDIQEMIGWNNTTSDLSGGIQGITEDTARTLEGLSNSILAQHVITNRYLSDFAVSGFAQVQLSWFDGMLKLQKNISDNTDAINSALSRSFDGVRSIRVTME